MTAISIAVGAATPSLLPGVVGDLSAALDFAAVFDVEMAADFPVVPKVSNEAVADGRQVSPPTAATTTCGRTPATSLENVGAPDFPNATDAGSSDTLSAVIVSPTLAFDLPVPIASAVTETAGQAISTGDLGEEDPLNRSPVTRRASAVADKLPLAIAKTKLPQQLFEPMTAERISKPIPAADGPLMTIEQPSPTSLDHVVSAVEGVRHSPTAASPGNSPVERLLATLSHDDPAQRQWLDTVIRDVASVAVKSGDVRFRVEPEGYGRMTIERTADRLEISVSEPRAMVVAEAARPQVVAGAATLGVPVAGATVVLDQSGQRGREEARQRQQIEHRDADEAGEDRSSDIGRYA